MKKYTRKGNLGYSPFIEYFFMKKFCFGKHKEFLSYPFLFAEILFFKLLNMKKIIITLFLVLSLFIYKPLFAYDNENFAKWNNYFAAWDYDLALYYLLEWIKEDYTSDGLFWVASTYQKKWEYIKAIDYYKEALKNYDSNKSNYVKDYMIKYSLWLSYMELQDYKNTLFYFLSIKNKIDELNLNSEIPINALIGTTYSYLNDSLNTEKYFSLAKEKKEMSYLYDIEPEIKKTNSCGINSYSNWDWKCSCEEWYERSDKNDLTNLNCSKIEEWDLVCKKSFGSNSYYIWTKTDDWKYNCNCSTWYVWNSNGNKCVEEKTADELYKLGLKYIEEWDWINGIYYMNEAKKTAESGNNINLINEINDMYKFLSVDDINIANYLAVQWIIVNHSSSPLLYNLGRNVLRQEIASISLKLWWIEKKNKCDNLFSDISSIKPNDWVCLNIEPLLERWLISNNKKFRPEENITKAEALWMLIKVKWLDYKLDINSIKTWQQQIVEYAVREWLVKDFTDYDTYATRAWIFKVVDNILWEELDNILEWLY